MSFLITMFVSGLTVWGSSSNLKSEMRSISCNTEVLAQLSPKLQKQTWVPKMVSVEAKPLAAGISFRDTQARKAYKIWGEKKHAFLVEADLDKKTETVKEFDEALNCKMSTSQRPMAEPKLPTIKGFTDDNLKKTMSEHEWGMIYVWTPYMPLSVRALKEIKKAVAAKKGHLTILLDAKANPAEAKKWVDKGQVKADELTPVASHELIDRDIGVHYPVAFIYKDKFLSNRELIGFKSDKMYQKWIDYEMAQLKKDMM